MKTLILVRHAKSSWAEPGMDDFDRPLNERGKKDAPEMGKRLKERGVKIDLFLSSSARRARKTAALFAERFGIDKKDIELTPDLYHANPQRFKEVIARISDEVDSVAVFAHNPGITSFASSLTNVQIDDMPTSSVFAVQAQTDSWALFDAAEKLFLFFDYPRNPMG